MGSPMWSEPRGRAKMRRHRKDARAPNWVRVLVIVALVVVVGTLAWWGVADMVPRSHGVPPPPKLVAKPDAGSPATWQREAAASFDAALREATAGNLTAAQMAVDRGAAIVIDARVQRRPATPDYFETSIAQLDRVVHAHPGNERLDEHVNLARIEIAQLRSSLDAQAANATPALASAASDTNPSATPAAAQSATNSGTSPATNIDANRVSIGAPQSVAAGATVDPASMGGSFIDATLMPHTSELLEPPSSRTFADKVRVENLTFAGATQTLDGLRFKNVTFIGTRLRFEGGQVELQNVRFVRCTFGFTTDARGARLANAVALGHTSLLIE
jgi:hypothetical protein